jgi:hypothetical protein
MVLWDGRLPHQNYPNTGMDFRVVMYLNFKALDQEELEERRLSMQRKLVVMRALGHDGTGPFPTRLTDLGRDVITGQTSSDGVATDDASWSDPSLHEAIRLAHQAGLEELENNLAASVECHRRASRMWPDIERDWYDVIFA